MKDYGLHQAGRGATSGSRLLSDSVSTTDTTLMSKLIAAGVNCVGRSTASEFAIMSTVETRAYGKTRNPWNLDRISGGSSGGAAAAVAAGIVPIAHGTDAGGRSSRILLRFVGLKPTRGRISSAPWRRPVGDMNYNFVLTRSVRDELPSLTC